MKSIAVVLKFSKKICLEVTTERNKNMFMPRHRTTGQSHNVTVTSVNERNAVVSIIIHIINVLFVFNRRG
jgi:hypothetical protein